MACWQAKFLLLHIPVPHTTSPSIFEFFTGLSVGETTLHDTISSALSSGSATLVWEGHA